MERNCFYCGEPIDPASRSTWVRIVGWEHKAHGPTRRSGSDIALRERRDEYAHDHCVSMARNRVNPQQEAML